MISGCAPALPPARKTLLRRHRQTCRTDRESGLGILRTCFETAGVVLHGCAVFALRNRPHPTRTPPSAVQPVHLLRIQRTKNPKSIFLENPIRSGESTPYYL